MYFKSIIYFPLIGILLLTLLFETAAGQTEQEDTPLKDELRSLIKNESFNVSGLVQAVGRLSMKDDTYNGGRTFQAGNARLSVAGILDGDFNYRIQFNLANEPNLLDAYVGYRYNNRFQFRVGAQKPMTGADLFPSPGETDFIDRARLVGAMLKSRELGISFFGDRNGLSYNLGIYNGSGLSANPDNKFYFTGLLRYVTELSDEGELQVGINGAFGESQNTFLGASNLRLSGNRYLYGVFSRYEDSRLILAGEILGADVDVVNYITDNEQVFGSYLTVGMKPLDNLTLLARWDHLSFNQADQYSNQFILGIAHTLTEMVSLQYEVSGVIDQNRNEQLGISAQLQVMF